MSWRVLIGLVAVMMMAAAAGAVEIHIAVASNFSGTIREVARHFEDRTGHRVVLAFASTGKHYAQIRNGAPFAAFLGADAERPRRLEQEGLAVPDSRFTYAIGRLVLWSPQPGMVDAAGEVLEAGTFRHLAMANPRLAPYGRAARQVLENRKVWNGLQDRIVRGENIAQAFQFVASGNAELGFVAGSQVARLGEPPTGSWWQVPEDLYSPIEQQAVLLVDEPVTREFLRFVRGEEARAIIRSHGYGLP